MDADRQIPEDLSGPYASKTEQSGASSDVSDMEKFLSSARTPEGAQPPPPLTAPVAGGDPGRPLPPGKPIRAMTGDPLGRIMMGDQKPKNTPAANIREIPGAAVGGVESAIHNALGWAIDPLANWLNENVADLSYKRDDPKTPTGQITKSVTEFLTGFVPAIKGIKAIGIGGRFVAPAVAGAISDFAVRDPASGRLADIWKQLKLPDNILTDYLSSKPTDSEAENRFKNALEGTGLGVLTEGVLMGARMIRAAKNIRGAKQAETEYLRDKYGTFDDETYGKVVGDPSKPSVEMVVHEPPTLNKKIAQGAEDTKDVDARSVIRNKAIVKAAGAKNEPLADNEYLHGGDIADGRDTIYLTKDPEEAKFYAEDRGGEVQRVTSDHANTFDPYSNPDQMKKLKEFLGDKSEGDPSFSVFDRPDVRKYLRDEGFDSFRASEGELDGKQTFSTGVLDNNLVRKVETEAPKDNSVYINFAKFDEPEEVKNAIGNMADAAKGTIDEARRGVITHEETQKLADDLGMTVTDLLRRREGQTMNAEEAVAARQLWAASAEKLVALAKVAGEANAGPLDIFAFRRQMAVHAAIQSEVIGARTETARALSAWKIPVKGDIDRARAVDQIMQAMGGPEQSGEMARRLAILSETNANPAAIAEFVRKGATANTLDAIKEAWINGLLSSPKTHAVNVMSNTLVAFGSIIERQSAGMIRAMTGGEGVELSEGAAMTFGMVSSIRDAFRMAAKAVKTGETSWSFNKMDLANPHAISPEAFGMSRETGLGRFVDFLGTATRVPTRLLGAEDEFFKTIGYRMELHAQAARTARQEGLVGYDFGKRVAEIVQNPPENIMINSADAALYQTFTNEVGNFGQSIMNFRNNVPALTFILPFVRTPVNIARYALERTPFAPLVGQWRADIAAGGARADLALARMSTGTALMITAMDLADKGIVSGNGEWGGKDTGVTEAMQAQGWQPYSVKINDKWYSYNRADPFGMTMGFAASIAEAIHKGEVSADEVDEWQEVMAMSIAAVSQVTISKTYLQGFAQFVEVMADPKRYSQKYIDDLFASFLPATALMAGVKNMVDPVAREVNTPADAVMARIAKLSESLPPRRNVWGEPLKPNESGLGSVYDFTSPIGVKQEKPSPIDHELVRLNHGVQKIGKQTNFDGVQANMRFYPKAYDDYTRLAGNDLKHPAWGLGAKDYLNQVVSGQSPMSTAYNIMSDDSRRAFINNTVQDYRKLAQQQILADPKHAAFANEITHLKQLHQQAQMPVLGGPQ